jgi:hypothetical protein
MKSSVALLVVFLLLTLVTGEVVVDAFAEPTPGNVLAAAFGVFAVGLLLKCLRDVGRGGRRG